jgi:hypothetical protein
MSSALTNSLQLLNEIRDQLNASKSQNSIKIAPLEKLSARGNDLPDQYHTTTSVTTEEEPLRVELNRRAFNNIIGSTPPVSQKYRPQDTEEDSVYINEPNFAQNIAQNNEPSPYKRKILGKDLGKDSFSSGVQVEKITQRSQEMASNLKKMLNKEIDSFSKECDALKEKVQSLIGNKATLPPRPTTDNFQLKGTRKNFSPDKENLSENALHQITRKIEKLAGEFDEKKNRSMKGSSILETLGGSPGNKSKGKLDMSEYETPSLSGTSGKLLFE